MVMAVFGLAFACYWIDHENAARSIAAALGYSSTAAVKIVFGVGALVIAAGAALRTWATAYLQSSVVHDLDLHAEKLVADGPYRQVRNPLYLGVLLLCAGIGLLASRLGWVVLVVGATILYLRLIFREEAALAATQGKSFRDFQAAVPRLIPSLRPRIPASGRKPDWAQAFIGESFMWALTAAASCFAVTLNQQIMLAATGVVVAIYAAGQVRRRLGKRPRSG
jgi:protein-S-isoprenylcysteine O-methyltransferase Ste14